MAYVPPHKRAGGETNCRLESMRFSSKMILIPKLFVPRAPHYVTKLLVVDSLMKLKFGAFKGESPPHLIGTPLHVAVPARDCDPEAGDALELSEKLEVIDRSFPALLDRIYPDLVAAADRVGSSLDVPKLVLRFGRLLFNTARSTLHRRSASRSSTTDSLSEVRSFSPDFLERGMRDDLVFGTRILKTFATSLSADYFYEVQQLAMQGSPRVAVKDLYTLGVSSGGRTLRCICYPAESNRGLVLKKIKSEAWRHLVVDTLCVRKKVDLRVMLYTETKISLQDLSDEEITAVRAFVDAAVIDEHVKGGLNWPLGTRTRGNLSVGSAEHRRITTITGKDTRWKFLVANRGKLQTFTGELSREIDIKPLSWKDNLVSRGQGVSAVALHTLMSEIEKYM